MLSVPGCLAGNSIIRLPESIGKLKHLRSLDLSSNKLQELPITLGSLSNLQDLTVEDNSQLATPPPNVVRKGVQAILRFLRRLQYGEQAAHRAKLALVGAGHAGKTSLLHAMQGKRGSISPNRTTLLEVESGHWEPKLREHPELRLHAYDFGGQQVYCSTHRLFLTSRTLVLVVVDLHQVLYNPER